MRSKILISVFVLCCHLLSFGQIKVTFLVTTIPSTKETDTRLFIAGDFNSWDSSHAAFELQKQNDGTWRLSKSLPKGAYNFKITRGSWQKVECTAGGKSIDNRSFALSHDTTIRIKIGGWQDNFKPEEKKHTASANVHIITEKFDILQLDRQRRIWIYLPADYELSHRKYPVIYMHDGQNLFDEYTSGYGEWGIDEIMDKMPDAAESIIVGIDHGGEYRITEYDPYDSKYGKGQGIDYVDFLVKTLKPYIDAHYRTKKDAKHTTIAGSSMGGLISMYAVLKYPEVFGTGGIFSPAFWIAPPIYDFAKQQSLPPATRFYFVCGDSEGPGVVENMQKMADIIQAKRIEEKNITTVIMQGERHNEKQWNKDFPAFYNWLIKGY